MSAIDKIKALSARASSLVDSISTEEGTKNALIMPFLSALGFDVFDPTIVIPEFTADIGTKKGEKVDYAIMHEGKPIILIEAKKINDKLDSHNSQLHRYFSVTKARFSLLTNGIEYRFYSDLDETNIMDKSPFLAFNLLSPKESVLKELEKFTSDKIDAENILKAATRQKNLISIREIFKEEIEEPSDELVRFFARKLTNKKLTQGLVEEYKSHVRDSFKTIITDLVKEELDRALGKYEEKPTEEETEEHSEIATTEEETEMFHIVKSILAEVTEISNITMKDTKTYCGVLFQDNTRKWILRFYFGTGVKFIVLPADNKETVRFDIEKIEDIYNYKAQIINVCKKYI